MMNKKTNRPGILALTILAMMALVTGISFASFSPSSTINKLADCPAGPMKADLTGTEINGKTPSGKVEFKKNSNLSVKVKSVSVSPETPLSVFVGDNNIGQITVSKSGSGELKLDSATVTEGSIITVKNGDVILLTGSFACSNSSAKTASPTATATATVEPTQEPTVVPTATATAEPTTEPTTSPTVEPTIPPTETPTVTPTPTMTATPTVTPTETPTITPPLPM